jgi:mannose-6-phosphate isomerase-like protein (cupin superfamily)
VHSEQEETFIVPAGILTMHLGEPPKRQVIPVGGIVHVTSGTPVQTVNEGDNDLVVNA